MIHFPPWNDTSGDGLTAEGAENKRRLQFYGSGGPEVGKGLEVKTNKQTNTKTTKYWVRMEEKASLNFPAFASNYKKVPEEGPHKDVTK